MERNKQKHVNKVAVDQQIYSQTKLYFAGEVCQGSHHMSCDTWDRDQSIIHRSREKYGSDQMICHTDAMMSKVTILYFHAAIHCEVYRNISSIKLFCYCKFQTTHNPWPINPRQVLGADFWLIRQGLAHDLLIRPVFPSHGVVRIPKIWAGQSQQVGDHITNEAEYVHGIEVVVVNIRLSEKMALTLSLRFETDNVSLRSQFLDGS